MTSTPQQRLRQIATCLACNGLYHVQRQLLVPELKWVVACDCGRATKQHDNLEDADYCWNWMNGKQPLPQVDEQ